MDAVVIGLGRIGTRHLEGLLKSKVFKKIFIYEKDYTFFDSNALGFCRSQTAVIRKLQSLSELPKCIDVAVISTDANNRLSAATNLLKQTSVKNLLLEKIIFNKLEEFASFERLVCSKKIDIRVNTGKRYDPLTEYLKGNLNGSNTLRFHISGGDWGLLCNAIHFIDLVEFITKTSVTEMSSQLKKFFPSKRCGYVEAHGTVYCNFGARVSLKLDSRAGSSPIEINIGGPGVNYGYSESSCALSVNGTMQLNKKFFPTLQSCITSKYCKTIEGGTLPLLPTYRVSKEQHVMLLKTLAPYSNQLMGCRIT